MRATWRTPRAKGESIRAAFAGALVWSAVTACRSTPIDRGSGGASGRSGGTVLSSAGFGPAGRGGEGNGEDASAAAGGALVENRTPPRAPSGAPDWMYDPSAWAAVDTLPGCFTRVAREPRAIHPRHAFTSCGAGCRRSEVIPGSPSLAAKLGTSARVVDGELRISLSTRIESDRTVYLLGTYAFGDGKPSVLIAEDGRCLAQLAGRGSLSTFRIFPLTEDFQYRIGWVEPSDGQLTWPSPPATWQFDGFDYGSGWGGLDTNSHGQLFIAPDPRRAEVTTLYSTSGVMFYPFASNGVVAVTESLDEGRVLLWRPGGEVWVAATGPWYAVRVGLSAERLAWLAATGERASDGLYESATVYSCALPASKAKCAMEKGPALPIVGSTSVLSVQGRWIALVGCSATECDAYLVDWQHQVTYRVRRVASDHSIDVIGLSDTELFVADYSAQVRGTADFDGIIRYDLARIDDFATRL